MVKLLLVMPVCQFFNDRRDACRRTWLKDYPYPWYMFIGKGAEHIVEDRLIHVDVGDDRGSLWDKMLRIFDWALQREDWDYLLKVDDDTFVNCSELETLDYNWEYAGSYVDCLKGDHCLDANGGNGYFLSRKAVELVKAGAKVISKPNGNREDHLVAEVLHKQQILPATIRLDNGRWVASV